MISITIRSCQIEDAFALQCLNEKVLGYSYDLLETKTKLQGLLLQPNHLLLVAEVANEVVGYVHAVDYEVIYAPHMKDILGIAVFPAFQGEGIGRALLQEIEHWAKDTNASAVRLVSGESRLDAHVFYRRCGYECFKKQHNFKKQIR